MGGSFEAAKNREELRRLGITHIVNATSHALKAESNIKIMCLNLRDCDGKQDIARYFWPVIEFIDEARASGSSVLVHCVRGVSRSTTLVCAYVMARYGLSAGDAVKLAREARSVANPRDGFIKQLGAFRPQTRIKAARPPAAQQEIASIACSSGEAQDFSSDAV